MQKTFMLLGLLLISGSAFNQTAAEILAKYTELSGGHDHWEAVTSIKAKGTALLTAQNMELPFLRIQMRDGKQFTSLEVNGSQYIETAYDGETIWGSNQQMELEEKGESAKENLQRTMKEFPYPGHNWEQNGFQLEFLGIAAVGETSTYKVKMTKDPVWVNGVKEENYTILYFDQKSYLPILTESKILEGPNSGKTMQAFLEDYRKVQGLWYPFKSTMKIDDQTFQVLVTEAVEFNKEIDQKIFKMPGKD